MGGTGSLGRFEGVSLWGVLWEFLGGPGSWTPAAGSETYGTAPLGAVGLRGSDRLDGGHRAAGAVWEGFGSRWTVQLDLRGTVTH